jgi:hypothetical protein
LITPAAITITAETGASMKLDTDVFALSNDGTQMLLDANANVQASGGGTLTLDSTATMASAGNSKLKLDASATLSSDNDVKLEGTTVSGSGLLEASLTVGGQSVKCTPASVDVAGATVNVNGSMMVSIAAGLVKIN